MGPAFANLACWPIPMLACIICAWAAALYSGGGGRTAPIPPAMCCCCCITCDEDKGKLKIARRATIRKKGIWGRTDDFSVFETARFGKVTRYSTAEIASRYLGESNGVACAVRSLPLVLILRSVPAAVTLRSRGISREQKGVARLIAGCCSMESGKRRRRDDEREERQKEEDEEEEEVEKRSGRDERRERKRERKSERI